MAKGFDRLHIKSAVKSHNKINLDQTHLTTMDFGQIVPLFSKALVPGDKINVNASYFSRMAPLVRPTYGKFHFKTMEVFVPFHQVAYDVEAWLAGKTTWEGITPSSRFISYVDYVNLFSQVVNGLTSVGSIAAGYDFSVIGVGGNVDYRKFTQFGKYCIKVLNALGYTLPQNVDLRTTSSWYSDFGTAKISALPLLCFAKAYNDYMSQSQRFNTSLLTSILREVKYNINGTYYNSTSHCLTIQGIKSIFENIKLCYENDYFTSAWQKPNSALNANESQVSASVPAISSNIISNGNVSVALSHPVIMNSATDHYVSLAQRSLDFLKSYDDWVRRNNYSGSRPVQQVYSRFGIKTDDYKSHYAQVLDTNVMPIQVGDVTSTADTTQAKLGDYAGKGIMSGGEGMQFHSSDYGYLFILGWFTINPMMSYGFDKEVLKNQPLDYYNPEFDGIGAEAISFGEVFTNPKNPDSNDSTLDNYVYGYTERYNEYRFSRDVISGEFRDYDNSADMNTWHTGRLLTAVRSAQELTAQSSSMNTLPQYDSEFKRIFSVTSGRDPFYLTCNFNVSAVRPMLSLNQVPKLGEGDTNVPRNGNEIN